MNHSGICKFDLSKLRVFLMHFSHMHFDKLTRLYSLENDHGIVPQSARQDVDFDLSFDNLGIVLMYQRFIMHNVF